MPPVEAGVIDLPDDSESLRAMVRSLLEERDGQRQRAEEQQELFTELAPTSAEFNDPAERLIVREQADRLLGYLQELPAKCQRVFKLHRFDGVSQQEVGARLGFSERMVRRYVTYAMLYCHLRLEGMSADQVRKKVTL